MATYSLNINGAIATVNAEADMPLLWVLRDVLNLTGTKFGCGVGLCGACTVLVDGQAARTCTLQVSASVGKKITTIEGLSADGNHPLQNAWIAEAVSQCGYCQMGQLLTAAALLKKNPAPSDSEIDAAFANHLCRCGTYQRIRRAVHRVAAGG